MRGIYLRGKIYWFQLPMKSGQRPAPITLETEDAAEAIKRANEIRDNPTLTASGSLVEEIKTCVAYKLRMRKWTPANAKKSGSVLLAYAATQPAEKTAADITTAELQRYHDALQKRGLSDTTIHGYMMSFRSFFKWATEVQKLVRRNPVDGVCIVQTEGKAREDFASYELRDKLIAEAPDDDLRFILYMGFHAGLRKMEIIQARAFWFDLDGGMLNLRKTETMQFKDREERSIPMTRAFVAFMRKYGLRVPFALKPEVAQGKHVYRYDFRLPLERYMKAQGVEWLTTHIMRHTFASLLASAGVSIFKIAAWLGDDVATVQKHYAKLLPGDKDIEKAFGDRKRAAKVGKRRNEKMVIAGEAVQFADVATAA